jgi:hypothetical protein
LNYISHHSQASCIASSTVATVGPYDPPKLSIRCGPVNTRSKLFLRASSGPIISNKYVLAASGLSAKVCRSIRVSIKEVAPLHYRYRLFCNDVPVQLTQFSHRLGDDTERCQEAMRWTESRCVEADFVLQEIVWLSRIAKVSQHPPRG